MGAAADAVLYRKLRLQIPRLHLTSLIVRVAQTLLLLSLSTFYALSEPEIFQDVFIWNPAASLHPPYELVIHRNFGRHWKSSEMASILGNRTDWPTITVQWNETGPPKGLGLGRDFPCPAGYLGCNGTEMAATRLSWLDSWPAETLPEWMEGSVYLDRYIFWSMIFGGFLAVGHNLIVFTHAIEPSGVGFYKYIAGMDFFISAVFLILGVFPLSILSHYKKTLPDSLGYKVRGLDQYLWDLEPSQKYAFILGWVMWGLYATSGILNCAMVVGIHKYKRLRAPVKEHWGPHTTGVVHDISRVVPTLDQPIVVATGYNSGNGSRGNTISRYGGRQIRVAGED